MSVANKVITETAAKWNDAQLHTKGEEKRADSARHQLIRAQEKEEALCDQLRKCVGPSTPRVCISMQNGSMVLVEYRKDHMNTVTVEELLR